MNPLTKYEIILRAMEASDIPQVTAIEQELNDSPWASDMFADSLRVGFLAWVLAKDQAIIGYGLLSLAADECQVLNIAINPVWQRKGLGNILLAYMLKDGYQKGARRCFLEVRRSNVAAQKLYEKLGFKHMGFRKDYYISSTGREDAVTLSLDLTSLFQGQ
jgi:[ribosomal protein S18]-alanine N-acetyltransferase